jgi:hypothetical protein
MHNQRALVMYHNETVDLKKQVSSQTVQTAHGKFARLLLRTTYKCTNLSIFFLSMVYFSKKFRANM